MLQLKNVSYSVNNDNLNIDIVKDLNLTFNKGITVITGQNGTGKSTLIKLIMNINKLTNGEIVYNGKNITNLSIDERANLGFTISFQQPIRFKGLKVKDLLDIATSKTNKLADLCEYLSRVRLCAKDYINRELNSTLSGGELKRIEIAVALAKGGEVFLFDEPEAGIDLWSFDDLIDIFKSLKDKIVIIVSHQEKIIECASSVVVLNQDLSYDVYNNKVALGKIRASKCGKLGGSNGKVN